MCDRMVKKHFYAHNNAVSSEMLGEKGHVLACDVDPRYQTRRRSKTSHKRLLKPVGGGTSFEFGESMSGEEALSFLKPRPGSESKIRELSGNHIFEGPYPVKENCGGIGSDITGRCPPRPSSSSKASELQGHNIFEAFSNPYHYPPPPPMRPYEPHEVRLPPDKIHRNPGKMSSQFRIGPPECIDPAQPKSTSAWARQKMLYGSMDMDTDSYPKPVVSDLKARELAGHTNLFGTPPSFSPPATPVPERFEVVYEGSKENPADSARQVHKTKMQALDGHNAVFLKYDPCRKPESQPPPHQPGISHAKSQELRGNDIFAAFRPDSARTGCMKLQQYFDAPH